MHFGLVNKETLFRRETIFAPRAKCARFAITVRQMGVQSFGDRVTVPYSRRVVNNFFFENHHTAWFSTTVMDSGVHGRPG